jgi:hypothetical protein
MMLPDYQHVSDAAVRGRFEGVLGHCPPAHWTRIPA